MRLGHLLGVSCLALAGCGGAVETLPAGEQDAATVSQDSGAQLDSEIMVTDGGVVFADVTTTTDGGGTGEITCGPQQCAAATQVCCLMQQSQMCIDATNKCAGLTLTCSSASSCGNGDVCCATFQGGGGGGSLMTSCDASCPNGPGNVQLCATDAECKNGDTCRSVMGGGTLKICRRSFDAGGPPDAGGGPIDAGPG